MTRPQTFVEHDILSLDASRGIRYQSFEDFWARRMEPMQFIPRDAKGPLGAVRDTLKDRAREQYQLWLLSDLNRALSATDGCGGLPQAGGAQFQLPRQESFP